MRVWGWVAFALLALSACADDTDPVPDANRDHPRSTGSPGGGESDFHFQPVAIAGPCAQTTSTDITGTEVVSDSEGKDCYHLLSEVVGGDIVESAVVDESQSGGWEIALVLTEGGIERFNELAAKCSPPTKACPTGLVAIVLDSEVLSAPTVQQPSFERDQLVITGDFSQEEADEIAEGIG